MNATDLLGAIAVLLSAGFVISFINAFRTSRVRTNVEKDRTALYTESCGGWFDLVSLSSPFVRVSVYDGFLTITYYEQIVLSASDIDLVEVRWRPLKHGVQIHHHKKSVSSRIILWSWDGERLKKRIETHLHLLEMPHYGKKPKTPKVKTGKRESWPWLRD